MPSPPQNHPHRPSPLRTTSPPIHQRSFFLDRNVVGSPDHSDPESDLASDDSQATIEDHEIQTQIGYPLQRMIPIVHLDSTDSESLSGRSSNVSSRQGSLASLGVGTSYEEVVDKMLSTRNSFENIKQNRELMVPKSVPKDLPRVMIKKAQSANEMGIILELNQRKTRSDPWNPSPQLLHISRRENDAYFVMKQLAPYQQSSLKIVNDYILLISQLLEGLSFLHERGMVGLPYHETRSYMVDTDSQAHRYYFADFSVKRLEEVDQTSESAFERDVGSCGAFIKGLTDQVPQISSKFKALVQGMVSAEFGAESSKKLFEALCKSIDSSTLNSLVEAS